MIAPAPAAARLLALVMTLLFTAALVAAPGGLVSAQPGGVPIPRISPLKDPASAATGGAVSGDMEGEGEGDLTSDGGDFVDGEGDIAGDGIGGPLDLAPAAAAAAGAAPLPLAPAIDLSPQDSGASLAADPSAIGTFLLEAKLTEDSPPIASGMNWRVYASAPPDATGKMRLVGEAHGGAVTLKLRPGAYFVHASFGRAGITKRITVGSEYGQGTIVLNAGGLRLNAFVGKDQPLGPNDASFDVYAPDEGGSDERSLLVQDAEPGRVVALAAGIYHVVCRYGDANAVVRADIRVEPGKVTDATVFQKAARVTLKLVESHGGEALANTSWAVVTPAGEPVADFVGAFPSVVLASGDYTAIARHNGALYERNFTVEPGLNRDIEVLRQAK